MSGGWRYSVNKHNGGCGGIVQIEVDVTPGQQFPVVVGVGGAAGAMANTFNWQTFLNGGTGGASSFGEWAIPGGTGATDTLPGRNASYASTYVTVGSIPGGCSADGNADVVKVNSAAGAPGFVLVEW